MAENLTLLESSALLMLLNAGQEVVPNTYLSKMGIVLKDGNRQHLVDHKLVDVRRSREKGPVFYVLTDLAWRTGLEIIGDTPPAGSGYRGATIHGATMMIRTFLDRSGTPPSAFFAPMEESGTKQASMATNATKATQGLEVADVPASANVPEIGEVAVLIRKAYERLMPKGGEQVSIARIRASLPDLPRTAVDDAFRALSREPDVWIDPESDQKSLTAEERAAAVNIGNQAKHQLKIARR